MTVALDGGVDGGVDAGADAAAGAGADRVAPARVRRSQAALHPGAWWLWALGLALAATRSTNPLLLVLVVAVAGFVVVSCRRPTQWGASYRSFLRLGLVIIALTLVLQLILGPGGEGAVIVRIPRVPIPSWLGGLTLGGPVRTGPLLAAAYQALQVTAVFACLGAANSVCSPLRLLKVLPAALYEAGLVVTVALTVAPQAVSAAGRLRTARRLRGRPTSGLAGLRGLAVPLLESALDASLALAAAMDSRGYGRRGGISPGRHRLTGALTLTGLVALLVSAYGLFDASAPAALGAPLLGAGSALLAAGLLVAGRRSARTRHRPERFGVRAWLVAGAGLAAALATALTRSGLHPGTSPPAAPVLPALAAAGIALALLPALVAAAPRTAPAPAGPGPRPVSVEPRPASGRDRQAQ